MDNYNNTMKNAINMLSKILESNKSLKDPEVYHKILTTFKNFYRSDMIHRRSKPYLTSLNSKITSSALPEAVKTEFYTILDSNLCGTLENIDALLRFKFLFKDPWFPKFLTRVQKELQKGSISSETLLRIQQKESLQIVTDLKINFLKICRDLSK